MTDALKTLIHSTRFRFTSRPVALRFAARAVMTVILGDDETYWVVTLADGTRLLKAGYEAA